MRAEKFEWAVWRRVKAVLNEPDKLLESVNQSLRDLEASKSRFSVELLEVDKKIEAVKTKAERLGIAFADGMISESAYKTKSVQFEKQTDSLSSIGIISPRQSLRNWRCLKTRLR